MTKILLAALLALVAALPGTAQTQPPNPVLKHGVNAIWFENWIGLSNSTLRVAIPNGKVETIFEATRAPSFRLSGTSVPDGLYRFELRAATEERIPNDSELPALGDEERPETLAKPFYMTGGFLVERGRIVPPEEFEEEERSE